MALVATGATPASEDLRFVACPIYRDTDAGKKSGCWLADDPATGLRYDVSLSPTKPDWNHAVLVEGRAASPGAQPCGGAVLEPVRVSVLDESCTRFKLEAESFPGRTFALPTRNVRPLYEARVAQTRPFLPRRFSIPFDFGSSFIVYQLGDYYLDGAINYALDVLPVRITITGHADTEPAEVSGRRIAEPASLARDRADRVAQALVLRGISRAAITITTDDREGPGNNEAFDGLNAASGRRVEVAISPQ
ncbi:hypothetical protein [Sphingomonas sp. Leaf357]|uniref:hypothetical protein n=1 Tax=Sphingomonas sp. Leaf357 TaxID=1736350 RepID=UPI0014440C50|nr:hypothetical protein [Sphingomonas sp. Leaf357]